MPSTRLHVTTLGKLCVECREGTITADHASKLWLVLAYLVCHRDRRVSREELYGLLWGEEEHSEDPQNALKITVHRVRRMLDKLFPAAGRELLLSQDGQLCWNPEVETVVDCESFAALCHEARLQRDTDSRLELLMQALELYQGEFLPLFASESWVMPVSVFYHNEYLKAVEEALALLNEQKKPEQVALLCREALRHEPYSEMLYKHLLRALVDSGDPQGALSAYERIRKQFFDAFGVLPSEEIRDIYREAAGHIDRQALSPAHLRSQMREMMLPAGAIVCDYDFFRLLYQVHARSVSRSGESAYIALLTLQSKDGKVLRRKVLDHAVECLLEQIRGHLRSGDAVTRCSASQVLVMLPQTTSENADRVCERICRAYRRSYPHSAASIVHILHHIDAMDSGERHRPS